MLKYTKDASVLIYALILVSLALIMAVVILNNATRLSLNYAFVNTKDKLSRVISDNSRVVFKLAKKINSDGGGYVDTLSCPTNISMSGSSTSGTIGTSLYIDGGAYYCSGSYDNLQPPGAKNLKIYFNSGATDLEVAEYDGSLVNLSDSGVGKRAVNTFTDGDNTLIDFSLYNHQQANIDNYDDNLNSDNYRVTSTGAVFYPNNYEDNDVIHRKIKFGYISPGTGFNSVFWNNTKTSAFIERNINNNDNLNTTIGTSTGVLYLDSDKDYSMFLYKLDKVSFNNYSELKILEKLKGKILPAGVGYIQDNAGDLSLSGSISTGITGNEYVFDFQKYDYLVLLENLTQDVLSYSIRGFDSTSGSGMYIVPFDDSDSILLKYLGNIVVIDDKGRLIYEQKEVVGSK